ncbi:hypothetical protein [Thermodesulfovibrio sp. TK110]
MKINFTKHALLKIELLKKHGFILKIPMIENDEIYVITIYPGRRQRYEKN